MTTGLGANSHDANTESSGAQTSLRVSDSSLRSAGKFVSLRVSWALGGPGSQI